MIKRITLAILLSLPILCFAQDTIVKKNGEEVQGKVTELTDSEVKYRKQENLDGPVYSLKKAEVLFIRYANGYKEIISPEQTTPAVAASDANSLDPVSRTLILEKKKNGKKITYKEQGRIRMMYKDSGGNVKELSGTIVDIKEKSLLVGATLVPIENVVQVRYKHPRKKSLKTFAYVASAALLLPMILNGGEWPYSLGAAIAGSAVVVGLVVWQAAIPEKYPVGSKYSLSIVSAN